MRRTALLTIIMAGLCALLLSARPVHAAECDPLIAAAFVHPASCEVAAPAHAPTLRMHRLEDGRTQRTELSASVPLHFTHDWGAPAVASITLWHGDYAPGERHDLVPYLRGTLQNGGRIELTVPLK